MAAFMALVLYYRDANIPTLVFVFYVAVLEWIRGLVKDSQNVRGDAIYGYRTVPVVLGLRKTRNLLLLSPLGFLPPLLWLTLFGKVHPFFPYLLISQMIVVLFALGLLWKSMNSQRLHTAQRLLKIVLLSAIAGLMLW